MRTLVDILPWDEWKRAAALRLVDPDFEKMKQHHREKMQRMIDDRAFWSNYQVSHAQSLMQSPDATPDDIEYYNNFINNEIIRGTE